MSFYGGASLAIYFLGEYGGIDVPYRIAIIALLLLTMPIALVIGYFATRKQKKEEASAEAGAETPEAEAKESSGDGQTAQKTAEPSGNFDEDLNKSADEVVQFLKSSNLGAMGDALYSLPWYLVAGDTRSGKTSLILGSDLNFQSLPSQRQSEQKLIRPTRQVDWRVTSDAVFVDTPGRLQSGNSDGDEWTTLLETIKKHRSNRPLDGLILSINTEKILNADENEIEDFAKTIRTRLDDATKRLKIRFPVYLVFTHADAIEGFRDSFSTSKKEGENLVWGSTFPLEKSDNAQALFDGEYEILQDSIMKRRLIRLSAPFSAVRQLRIFNFPLHFGSARRKLGTFVTTLFRPNPFSESPFLRGFYFTAVPVNRQSKSRNPATPNTVGETFFTKRFFRDVILRDKDLVKTFQGQRQSPPILGWILTFLIGFLTFLFLSLAAISLYQNYKFVQDATAKGKAVIANVKKDANRSPLEKSTEETKAELDAIENLRKILVKMDDYEEITKRPILMTFGLYSGNKIFKERLLYIYYSAIQRRFREPTIVRLKSELQQFSNNSESIDATNLTPEQEKFLGKNYNLLAAYLMLTEEYKDKADPTFMAETLKEYWLSESKLPTGYNSIAEEQMNFYFKQIDRVPEYQNDPAAFPRITSEKTLVDGVRGKLENYPAYLSYLTRKISEVSKEMKPITIDGLLDGRGQGVIFAAPGFNGIQPAFTIEGYRKFMKDAIAKANEEIRKEDWVRGKSQSNAKVNEDELKKLKERYFNLYTDNWRELIRKTKVKEFKQLEDMQTGLKAFSDTESPMKILLLAVARNTKFSSKPEAKGWFDFSWISDWWKGKNLPETKEAIVPVEREFDYLFKFVGLDLPETDKPVIDTEYGKAMESLDNIFGKISASDKETISVEIEKKNKESDAYNTLDRAEIKVSGLSKNFKTNAEEEIANLLKEPINQIRFYFGEDALTQLKRDWSQKILPKAQAIEKGYPFTDEGEADLTELSKFLNPQDGELSKFYKDRLDDYFEERDKQIVLKDSSKYKFTPAFIKYLNDAFKLRDVLYGESEKLPNFKYDFRIFPVDKATVIVTLDGQDVKSEETGSKTIRFPAPQGKSSGVKMSFMSNEDTSGTSGDTLPENNTNTNSNANNSNSNVNVSNPFMSNYLQDAEANTITKQGTWGLFRFFESASAKTKEGDTYTLTYKLGEKTVKITIKPQGGDLFERSIFTNVKAPPTIIE